jgi:purine-binding chemotaxis protein CheW
VIAPAEHVSFLLAGQLWAVRAERVHEVVVCPAITPVPFAPVGVAGVVALRGDVLCVLDPGPGLGLPQRTTAAAGAMLVADSGTQTFGVAVDEVLDVVPLDATRAGTASASGTDHDGRLHQILDVDRTAAAVDGVRAGSR